MTVDKHVLTVILNISVGVSYCVGMSAHLFEMKWLKYNRWMNGLFLVMFLGGLLGLAYLKGYS